MAQMKLHGKDITAYENIDVDALLATLTEAELEELGTELIDPDDSCIPPSERCRYKTDKAPTGPLDRKALLDFIEKKAREEKDWEDPKPYKKEIRGKIWKRKEQEKIQLHEDVELDTEWDEVLASATEEELVDLAAILGFHGMLNQVQYHQAFVEEKDEEDKEKPGGGFQGVAKHQEFKLFDELPANATDVEDSLQRLKDNDPKLTELNLNNIKTISLERLMEFGRAVKDNTHLEKFFLANTKSTDRVAKVIAESLKTNKTLKSLTLESNYISGQGILAVLEAAAVNKTLTELRVTNQRPSVLGNKVEMRIAELVRENVNILVLGIFLESPAKVLVREFLQRNNDNVRRGRVGKDLIEAPEAKQLFKRRNEPLDLEAHQAKIDGGYVRAEPTPAKKEESEEEEDDDDDDDDDDDETESSEEE